MEEKVEEKDNLTLANELIENGEFDEAQKKLSDVLEKSGRWYFVQGKLYKLKNWNNEARKCFETAIKSEPDNKEYKTELAELKKSFNYKQERTEIREQQMGNICDACCIGYGC